MNEDQSYWYERGLHAGKVLAAEAQGYKEAYFALVEAIAKNEALLPRQTILTMPQRTWVNATTWRGLTDEERDSITCDMVKGWVVERLVDAIEAKLKEKNNGS